MQLYDGRMYEEMQVVPFVPVILGIVLLLLGYYLDAEVIRILWIVVAGLIILLGTFGLVMISRMKGM